MYDEADGREKGVAVLGGSGYAGSELMRLLASHPRFDVVAVTAGSHEGMAVADRAPGPCWRLSGPHLWATEVALRLELTWFSAPFPTGPLSG